MDSGLKKSLIFRQHNRILKRLTDIVIAVPSIIIISPLMFIIAILVRLDSRGNPLFAQVRLGRDGNLFTMYKIRTLRQEHFGLFTDQEEPHAYRITRIGKYLRRSKIDEVPQLINVLLGHMAIVGPRPDLPLHLKHYTKMQYNRFLVKPGLTGLTQVSGNTALSWPNRLWLDLWYIEKWTALMDLRIIAYTFTSIFKGETLYADPFNLHQRFPASNRVTTL